MCPQNNAHISRVSWTFHKHVQLAWLILCIYAFNIKSRDEIRRSDFSMQIEALAAWEVSHQMLSLVWCGKKQGKQLIPWDLRQSLGKDTKRNSTRPFTVHHVKRLVSWKNRRQDKMSPMNSNKITFGYWRTRFCCCIMLCKNTKCITIWDKYQMLVGRRRGCNCLRLHCREITLA